MLVGALRLFLPLVPGYQQQIRAGVAAATGLTVEFSGISASWPLRGPELQLLGVVLSDPDSDQPLLEASEISLGLSLYRLLSEQRLSVERVLARGARVRVERDADGLFLLQGRPLSQLATRRQVGGSAASLRILELRADDLQLSYTDQAGAAEELVANFRQLRLESRFDGLSLEARAELSGVSGGDIELSATFTGAVLPFAGADWDFSLAADGISLAPLLRLLMRLETPLRAGGGELMLAGRMHGLQPGSLLASLDLRALALRAGPDEVEHLERLAGRFEWETRADGWLLAASDFRIGRKGRLWPASGFRLSQSRSADGGLAVDAEVSYLRNDDLYVLLRALATDPARERLLPAGLEGEVRDLNVRLRLPSDSPPVYDLRMDFTDLGIRELPGGVTFAGLSGKLAADQNGGRLELASAATHVELPEIFQDRLRFDELVGFLVWRKTPSGLRVLSDNVRLRAGTIEASTRFELSRPAAGDLELDLDAAVRAADATEVLPFLPLRKFPPRLTDWSLRAIRGGEIQAARVRLRGPLRAFPYAHGEGLFRVDLHMTRGEVAFARAWPELRELDAEFVVDGLRLYSRHNTARLGALSLRNVDLRLDDWRRGALQVAVAQRMDFAAVMEFLRNSPLRQRLGPAVDRLRGTGALEAKLKLDLPLQRLADFSVRGDFVAAGLGVAIDGTPLEFDDVRGRLRLDGNRLSADHLDARLLGAPLTARLLAAESSDTAVGHRLLLNGNTPVRAWLDAFRLPGAERLEGRSDWQASVLIPRPGSGSGLQLSLRSELVGVSSRFPEPLRKGPDEPAELQLTLDLGTPDTILVDGRLAERLRWRLRLVAEQQRWRLDRGGIVAGDGPLALPEQPGVVISGRVPRLVLRDWLDLAGESEGPPLADRLQGIDGEVGEFDLFGQRFTDTRIALGRAAGEWRAEAKGQRLAGALRMPLDFDRGRLWRLKLQRLWLGDAAGGASDDSRPGDPRALPRMRVQIQDFRIGEMQFGRLQTELLPGSDGVTASPLTADGGSFTITGDGGWLVIGGDARRQRSRLRATLASTDVADTLQRLGYGPVIEGESARAEVDLSWPGPPDSDFLARASGRFRVEFGSGALLQLDAGGGRLLGILSIASLPRRLALDFRDVFDEGFSFDSLQGEFELENGVAFTCNLGLEGPVADMAVVGRVGLAERDYDQLAVVRPHVSNVLALGGVAVGGPAGGVAGLLLSRIFRKQLSQVGESYYEIKGAWETPQVKRVDRDEVDSDRFSDCARYLAEVLPPPDNADELVTEPGSELPEEIVP